jgi:Rhodopirellula transposase DDE domain
LVVCSHGVMQSVAVLEEKFRELLPLLDERGQRLVLGAEARALGHGGIGVVARAAGVSRGRVSRGVAEVAAGVAVPGRVRRPGAGRRPAAEVDPGLVPALLALVEPDERGDPGSPLRWTVKSTRTLAAELTAQGHKVSADTVRDLLREQGFSLQGNAKTIEGRQHPDRDAQFRYINEQARAYRDSGDPVISVDSKKKELAGEFARAGTQWRPKGQPVATRTHDFPDPDLGKVIPYGVYDVAANAGWVNVGTDHDTAAFAVESIRRWWNAGGRPAYPAARRLLITADAGGSNGYRTRAWKAELAEFAAGAGLEVTICHFPPGTSKWNKIEHRLFSAITMNWRGRPLTSHQVIVNLIAATTTTTGLAVHAGLDTGLYPPGIKISNAQMAALPLDRHSWHGDWNYTLHPHRAPAPPPAPPRPAPADRAPAWLTHPTLTGHTPAEWDQLQARLTRPPAATLASRPSATAGTRMLSPRDRLLATILRQRWSAHHNTLARLFGVSPSAISNAVRETTQDLAGIGHHVPTGPIKATTTSALAALTGQQDPYNTK